MEHDSVVDIAMECLLSGASDRDPEERFHCRRVEKYCAMTAKELGWEPDEVADLKLAALLHHMDRSHVPESALAPNVAAYLSRFAQRTRTPAAKVETPDTKEEQAAGIIAVCDAFDRLVTTQRYRTALPVDDAMNVLRCDAGAAFDEATIEAFRRAYSVSSETGETQAA